MTGRPSRRPEPLAPDGRGRSRFALETRRATQRLAKALAGAVTAGDLVILSGDLGTGKTFLTRAMCRALGVPHAIPVTSPSFALVNEYDAEVPILHVDLYRLGDAEEVAQLGLRDRRADCLMIVEWGAPYVDDLGGQALHLELTDETDRRVVALWHDGARRLLHRALAALS
ncbi:MAG: tRNA (adenosine(37)-N6)-threonylcarbamoyltransferase complex ATPase subunit type 1 TsaE [Polyangiaceae bacterium]